MKIKMTITADVDPAVWAIIYGTDLAKVREDVREYTLNAVQQQPGFLESRATVTMTEPTSR